MKEKILDSMAYLGVACRTKEDYEVFVDYIVREITKANELIRKELASAREYCINANGCTSCKNCGLDFDDLLKKLS